MNGQLSSTIRDAIRRDGRSLHQLAADSDVDVSVLSRFMRSERGMNLESVERLCAVLGLVLRRTRRQRGERHGVNR